MTKKYFMALLVLFLGCTILHAGGIEPKKEKKASIKLDSTVAHIGTFPKSESARTVVYTFKNVGNDKLVI